jgi:hypothetical protein
VARPKSVAPVFDTDRKAGRYPWMIRTADSAAHGVAANDPLSA